MRKLKTFVSVLITHFNKPVKYVCDNLIGEQHSLGSRMFFGFVFMVVGVSIAKLEHYFQSELLKTGCDGLGYMIHGIGGAPFLDYLKKIIS